MRADFVAQHPHAAELAFEAFAEYLLGSLLRIRKRLGPEHFQTLDELMRQALEVQRRSGDVQAHRGWIEGQLRDYDDPMHAYQRGAKEERIVFAGERDAVIGYLREVSQSA